jgi:hypothetical protein
MYFPEPAALLRWLAFFFLKWDRVGDCFLPRNKNMIQMPSLSPALHARQPERWKTLQKGKAGSF